MSPLAAAAATLLTVVLVVVYPLFGRRRYEELIAADTSPERRRALLVRSMARKWVIAAIALAICGAAPFEIVWTGTPEGNFYTLVLLLGVGVGSVVLVVQLRSPRRRAAIAGASAKFAAILPKSANERRMFALDAITAGTTEEIAYRGFLIGFVAWALPGEPLLVAGLIAGVAFGFVHVYQGWKGVVQTGIIGIAFGVLYPAVGLITLILVHSLIDLRLLLLPLDMIPTVALVDEVEPGPAPP